MIVLEVLVLAILILIFNAAWDNIQDDNKNKK